MPNYQYVTTAQYRPYTMQEMLTPFMMYKEEYEKSEAAYQDLQDKMDTFSYLKSVAEENPDSKAARIYQGYADEMNRQFSDFISNGLNVNNRRGLTNLKRRYKGEIGRLEQAKATLDEITKEMRAKGSSYLWGNVNPTIDDVLDNPAYTNYGISSEDLYKRGAQFAQSASSRLYGNTQVRDLTRYYQEIMQQQGYSPELVKDFQNRLDAIPEFRDAVERIMLDTGAGQNLSGNNLERARQSIISGLIDGAAYKENTSVKDNPGVMTAAQEDASMRGWRSQYLQEGHYGYKWNPTTKSYEDRNEWMYSHDNSGRRTGYSPEYIEGYNATHRGSSIPTGMKTLLQNNGVTSNGTAIITGKDGTVSTLKMSTGSNMRYLPFYGDAFSSTAANGFDVEDWEATAFNPKEAEAFNFLNLGSEKAKNQIREYVKNIIPDIVYGLSDAQLDTVIGYMDFQRDHDTFSDSHFRLGIPGTDEEGKVVDPTAFNSFLSKINKMKMDSMTLNTGVKTSVMENGSTVSSTSNLGENSDGLNFSD